MTKYISPTKKKKANKAWFTDANWPGTEKPLAPEQRQAKSPALHLLWCRTSSLTMPTGAGRENKNNTWEHALNASISDTSTETAKGKVDGDAALSITRGSIVKTKSGKRYRVVGENKGRAIKHLLVRATRGQNSTRSSLCEHQAEPLPQASLNKELPQREHSSWTSRSPDISSKRLDISSRY